MSGWVPIRTVLEKPSPAGAVLPGEHLFLETPLLKVTDKRIVSGAATFALSGVTSVQLRLQRRSLMTAIILVGASLYFLILGCVQHWALAAAAAFMVCTIIHFRRRKIRFEAVLVTSSGQLPAFTTPDRAAAVSFITAVNRAIVARG